MVDATHHSFLHACPYGHEVVPDVLVLTHLHVFPVVAPVVITPIHDFRHGAHVIYGFAVEHVVWLAFRQGTSSNAVYGPFVYDLSVYILGGELHAVGMEGEKNGGLPHDVHVGLAGQNIGDGLVRHVSATGCRQTAVERHLVFCRFGMACKINLCCLLRSHGVAA